MRKNILYILSLFLLVTQCKKETNDDYGNNDRTISVYCDIRLNNNSRSDFTNLLNSGVVNWSSGVERIYLAVPDTETPQLIELQSVADGTPSVLTFSTTVADGLIKENMEYEIWYFGNSMNLLNPNVVMTKENGIITSISGNLANQNGTLSEVGYYHIASTTVTAVKEGDIIRLPLSKGLTNQISIALLDLETVSTLSGDAIIANEFSYEYNSDSNKFEFCMKENDNPQIRVAGNEGISYIVLLPNVNANCVLKCNKGEYSFVNGIESNMVYYSCGIDGYTPEVLQWNNTPSYSLPHCNISSIKNITATSAFCVINISDNGGDDNTIGGVCWSKNPNPTISDNHITIGTTLGDYSNLVSSLDNNTTYYFRAYATNSAGTNYGNEVSIKTLEIGDDYINGYLYVDLGLSVKWAVNNIGSNTLSGIGNHYAWGEIDSKPEYTLNNSLLYGKNIKDISGNPQYDVAKAEWGATWRIPSEEEWSELIDNCVWSFITIDDMYVYKVTAPNQKYIYLPAAGYRGGTQYIHTNEYGYYWSSDSYLNSTTHSYGIEFTYKTKNVVNLQRYYGLTIRPVSD